MNNYNISHSIPCIIGDGARCRVCAIRFSRSRGLRPGLVCAAHAPDSSSEEARLGRLAIYLQDMFFDEREYTWEQEGEKDVCWLSGLTESECWVWVTISMLWSQCERSITYLSPALERYQAHASTHRKSAQDAIRSRLTVSSRTSQYCANSGDEVLHAGLLRVLALRLRDPAYLWRPIRLRSDRHPIWCRVAASL